MDQIALSRTNLEYFLATKVMASLPPSTLPQCSLSWTQNGRSEQRIQPMATLDLHGYTKDRAIRAVTEFLERSSKQQPPRRKQNPFVCIVTGVGAHSGALGGPVLKQAVHKLLIKRNMEYTYAKKRGSFLVNVHSGHVLTQNPTLEQMMQAGSNHHGDENGGSIIPDAIGHCTKVKVMPRENHFSNNSHNNNIGPSSLMGKVGVSKKKKKHTTRNGVVASYAAASATVPLNNHSRNFASIAAATEDDCPLPSEIAAEEKLLESAKTQSLQDTRQIKSQRDKERHAFQRALQTTQQEALDAERQEQEELQRIMALSSQHQRLEEEAARQAEEAELERLLQLSLQDAQAAKEHEEKEEEELLQNVLSDSNLEHLQQQQDEEAELERILRMSLVEQEQQQQQKESVEIGDSNDEDEELQRVLRLSLVEASLHNDSHAGNGLLTDSFSNQVDIDYDYSKADHSTYLKQTSPVPTEYASGDKIYQKESQDLLPTTGIHGIVSNAGDITDFEQINESVLHPPNVNENEHNDTWLPVETPNESALYLSSTAARTYAGSLLAVESPNEAALYPSNTNINVHAASWLPVERPSGTSDNDSQGPWLVVENSSEPALPPSSTKDNTNAGPILAALDGEPHRKPAVTIADSSLPVITGEDLLESILYKQPTSIVGANPSLADHEGVPLNWQPPTSSLGGSPSMAITEHRVVLGNFTYNETTQGLFNTHQPATLGGTFSVAEHQGVPGGNHKESNMKLKTHERVTPLEDRATVTRAEHHRLPLGNHYHETSQVSLKAQPLPPPLQASQEDEPPLYAVPVLPSSVMEHRMMEIIQRPIVSSSQQVAQPQSGNF